MFSPAKKLLQAIALISNAPWLDRAQGESYANGKQPKAGCRTIKNLEEMMGYNVTVDTDKCVGCAQCVDVCPVGVYEMKDEKSDPVNADECVGCESCVEVCEGHCITVEEQ